jgi:hypothetical protein
MTINTLNNFSNAALLLAASFFASSCLTTQTQKTAASLSTVSQSANFVDLNKTTSTILSNEKKTDNHLLANMEGGLAAYHLKDYRKALELLTKADDELTTRYFKADVDIKRSFKDYFNRTARGPYLGNMHEKFGVCAYALLSCLGMKDTDQARVWANRIIEASEMAQELYQKREDEIAKYKKASDKARNKRKDKIRNFYSKLANVEVYPEFINPFALGLAAILKLSDANDANGAEEALGILNNLEQKTKYDWPKQLISKVEKSLQDGQVSNLRILIVSGGAIKFKKYYEWPLHLPSGRVETEKAVQIADLGYGASMPALNINLKTDTMCINDFIAIDSFMKANETFGSAVHVMMIQYQQSLGAADPQGWVPFAGFFDVALKAEKAFWSPAKKYNAADLRGWNSLPKEHRIAFIDGKENLPDLKIQGRDVNLKGKATGMEIIHVRSTQSNDIVHRHSLN